MQRFNVSRVVRYVEIALGLIFISLKHTPVIPTPRGDGSVGIEMPGDSMLIVEMKRHFQLRAIEWWSAGLMASWGAFVSLVPGLFVENHSFHGLLAFAPQQIWGFVALVVGIVRLSALTVNGFWCRTPAVRWATAMVSCLVWFLITAALVNAPILNPGVVVYGWLVVADIYSAFRSASDAVEAAAQRRLRDQEIPEASNVSQLRRT